MMDPVDLLGLQFDQQWRDAMEPAGVDAGA